MGTTGFVAQAFGRNDKRELAAILYRGLFIAACLGLAILTLQDGVWWLGQWMIHPGEEVLIGAETYFNARIWAAPANFFMMVMMGLLGR